MNKEEKVDIYIDIAAQVKKKFGKDFSLAQIHSIANSQFAIAAYGFNKGIGSQFPVIGKVVPFDMDTYTKNVILPNKELQQQLREEGKIDEAVDAYLDSYKTYKKIKHTKANEKGLTAEEVMLIPNLEGTSDTLDIFKNLR